MPHKILAILTTIALASACASGDSGSVSCGIAAMNGPLVAMEGFARGKTIVTPPVAPPASLPLRFVAGPAGNAAVSVDSSGQLIATTEAVAPENARPGYGVLIEDEKGQPMGVLIYDGLPIPGAPHLGQISVSGRSLPLLGVNVIRARVETPKCPLFPQPEGGN